MSANLAACFSSNSSEWATPQALFDQLNAEFGPFDLDAAASEYNHKCAVYYDKNFDALSVEEWNGKRVWLNPPYGRDLGKWVAKARVQAYAYGKRVVLLLPARTDTRWWWNYIAPFDETIVRFIKGRLKFEGAKSSAPFPSVIVVFDGLRRSGWQSGWCDVCDGSNPGDGKCYYCGSWLCLDCEVEHGCLEGDGNG